MVTWVNAYHLTRDPMPPPSSHRSWQLVPRMMHYFMGYDHRRVEEGHSPQLSSATSFYTLPLRSPVEWTNPAAVYREFAEGGRFNQLVGRCDESYSTCMGHAYAVPAAVGAMFPGRALLVALVPTFYFLAMLSALYGIAAAAAGRGAGLAAAAIAAGFPGLFGMARWPEGYIVTASLSTCMVWSLVQSRGMTRWAPLLLYGALTFTVIRTGEGFSEAAGAGLAVGGPFLVEVLFGFKEAIRQRRFPFRQLVGIAIVGAMLYATTDWEWVRGSEEQMRRGIDEVAMGASLREPNASELEQVAISRWLYAYFIVNDYVRPPLVGALLVSLPFLVFGKASHRVTMIAWFVVAFGGFSYMERKAIWYPIPMLPPLAALTAVGLASIPWRWPRVAMLTLAGAAGLHQLVALTIPGTPLSLPPWIMRPFPPEKVQVRWVDLAQTRNPDTTALHREAGQLLAWINAHVPARERLLYIAAVTPWGEDTTSAMRLDWYLTLHRPDIVVIELGKQRYLQGHPYEGLPVTGFFALVCIGVNGHFADCRTNMGDTRPPRADRRQAPFPFTGMITSLLSRARGPIPGIAPVLLLEHPETDGVDIAGGAK